MYFYIFKNVAHEKLKKNIHIEENVQTRIITKKMKHWNYMITGFLYPYSSNKSNSTSCLISHMHIL